MHFWNSEIHTAPGNWLQIWLHSTQNLTHPLILFLCGFPLYRTEQIHDWWNEGLCNKGQDSSVGRAWDQKARCNTDAGSVPWRTRDFSPTVNFQCRLSYGIHTAPGCSHMHHACVHVYIPNTGSHSTVKTHERTAMASTALTAAVAVPR